VNGGTGIEKRSPLSAVPCPPSGAAVSVVGVGGSMD
jgi:hypothetical protein